MQNIKIFACPTAEKFTEEICKELGLEMGKMDSFKFQNDNTFVQFKETVRDQDVYIVQTTEPPVNERAMELLITLDAAKRASPRRITVVMPYYIYSRSDKKDQPRIPVTAKLMAKLIETAGANRVLTCDLHNSAIQAYFEIGVDQLTARDLLIKYFKNKKLDNIVVVAPDAGSSKKSYKYAERLDCKIAMIDKRREDNNDKAISTNVVGNVKGKTCLIFDDEIVTGGSIIETARVLKENGAKDIYVGITHGILAGSAIEKIKESEFKEIVVTNTVPVGIEKQIDKIKVLSIAPLFAEGIKRINEGKAMGELFS